MIFKDSLWIILHDIRRCGYPLDTNNKAVFKKYNYNNTTIIIIIIIILIIIKIIMMILVYIYLNAKVSQHLLNC